MKKAWKQPTITVVGRGKPEEHVLIACKREDLIGGMYAVSGPCIIGSISCMAITVT